jgi:hypothetical protein
VLLSAVFTFALVVFGWALFFVGGAIAETQQGAYTFLSLGFLIVVAFLVYYAYPPRRRRWYHYALFELCVIVPFGILVPLVYLPWQIVKGRTGHRNS